jgi:hypothetical protein
MGTARALPKIYGLEPEGTVAAPAGAKLPVAIATVDRAFPRRPEGHLGVLSTLGAYCRMHLAPHTAPEASSGICAPGLTARWAALGFVGVTLLRVVLLVIGSKHENLVALHAS